MAFAAQRNELPAALWLLYAANLLWTFAYDTQYAMVDRRDDLIVGIKSSAVLFGRYDRAMIGALQLGCLLCLYGAGRAFGLGAPYYGSLVVAAALFAYQHYLLRQRAEPLYLRAFLHNRWVGLAVFAGIALHYTMAGA